jgi:hypothetical protein
MMRFGTWSIALAGGLLFVGGITLQLPYFNGSPYWCWPYRDPAPLWRVGLATLPGVALLAWAIHVTLHSQIHPRAVLLAQGLALIALQWGAFVGSDSLGFLDAVIRDTETTSFYTDAQQIDALGPWLAQYSQRRLAYHTENKPPGPVLLYYAARQIAGDTAAPLLGAAWISLIAAAAPWAVYVMTRMISTGRRSALIAAALYTSAAGPIVMFPAFDCAFPVFTALWVSSWRRAAWRSNDRAAIALGVTLMLATALTYNLLPLGALLVIDGWNAIVRSRSLRHSRIRRGLRAAAIALAVWWGIWLGVWLASGYSAPGAFLRAYEVQRQHVVNLGRSYWQCLVFDPIDFLRCAGFATLPWVIAHLRRQISLDQRPATRRMSTARWGVAFIMLLALTALLRGETMRLWIFALPLWLAPAGVELARQPRAAIVAVFLLQWLTVVILRAQLGFIGFGGLP